MNKQAIIENKIVTHKALTFDDVLLLPGYSDFKRQDVDLTVRLHPKVILKLPVISSPMDTVTESAMAIALSQKGGLGIIHRNMSVEKEAEQIKTVKRASATYDESALDEHGRLLVGAAVGTGPDFADRIKAVSVAGCDLIVLDSAHGHTKHIIDAVSGIRQKIPGMAIMAGNIATYDGAKALMKAGAQILRIGMGPGSICTTRIVTGMGVPQLSAVAAVVRATDGNGVTTVADGGIKQMGDIAKAIAFGAHAVMIGSLFARFREAPGQTVEIDGKFFKSYRGMGSITAMQKGGAERYGQTRDTDAKQLVAEGVEGLVEFKGSVIDYLDQVRGSLRSSFYYIGAKNITEMFEKSRVIKISNAGLSESHPHDVVIADAGGNYNIKK
ncbi:hypothetical protein A2154_00585 [Candidatus Gottesmanbacteria bacterium RBG_16_43_7]|uniref:IMP dehydrogenase/GMP reductase domain-containing protein n=1 Tax=Candidatus Gottesmanbacteria bacterium RBG_16_43_7 TaxID=1798373 RepID=A0A1F5Z846_9BACT|nr:MAG: hypothetical protein A2154_00585 [Candidatus Gottesmanbacteria bacterium RBG_16_43_7]